MTTLTQLVPDTSTLLYCPGHDGDRHYVGLNLRTGMNAPVSTWQRIAQYARIVLAHATVTDELDPEREQRFEDWGRTSEAVLDRADGDLSTYYVAVTAQEWLALVASLADGAEYMAINNYADDEEFPEDAAAARVFRNDGGGYALAGLNTCHGHS